MASPRETYARILMVSASLCYLRASAVQKIAENALKSVPFLTDTFLRIDELCRELYRKLCRNPLKGRSEIDKARDKAYDQEGLKLVLSLNCMTL